MAGDRQVGVDVRAKVTGQKDVDKLNKSVGELTDQPATLEVDAKVNPAIDRALDKLTQLDENARAAAVAAEELGRALGPELAGRADMTAVVTELKRLGPTFEEITANADTFAAKLKEVDSDDLGGRMGRALGTARGETEKLGDAAIKSRNAMANLVGNVSQDLGAFTGIAGSAGVAVGQLAEGAADAALGGQKLSSALADVAKVAGPMAALAVATELLGQAMAAAQASKAFDAANVDQYTDALTDGVSAVESFNDEIRETGELAYRAAHGGGLFGLFSSTKDLLPVLERAGLDVAQFNTIVQDYVDKGGGSADMNDRWRASLEATGVEMMDAIRIVKAANQESDARIAATEQERRVTELLGDSEADQAAAAREAADAERARNAAMESGRAITDYHARMLEESAELYDKVTDKLREYADEQAALAESGVTYADAQRAESEAMIRYGEALGDAEATMTDQVDAAIALAKAHQETTDRLAETEGRTRTATEKVDTFNDSLLATAGTLNGEARTAVGNYIADVNKVPPDKRTEFIALVEAGKLDEAKALLNTASETRTAAIEADATGTEAAARDLNNTANPNGQPRRAYIDAYVRYAQNFPNEISPGTGPRALPPVPPDGGATPAMLGAPMPVAAGGAAAVPMSGALYPSTITLAVPAPTVHVTLQSAVIGSPTAVARAVRRATIDAVRLAGTRP